MIRELGTYGHTLYLTTSPMIGPAIRRPPKGDNSIYVAIVLVNLPDIPFSKYSGLPYIQSRMW